MLQNEELSNLDDGLIDGLRRLKERVINDTHINIDTVSQVRNLNKPIVLFAKSKNIACTL